LFITFGVSRSGGSLLSLISALYRHTALLIITTLSRDGLLSGLSLRPDGSLASVGVS